MKTIFAIVAFQLFVPVGSVQAAAPDWLVGCWETPDKTSKEVWVAEPDGFLMGFGVSVEDGEIAFYEVLRIASSNEGALTYTAYPFGQAPATFTARVATKESVIFSNPSHDYPQEISYRREGNVLFAKTSALDGENAQSFNKRLCE